MIIWPLCHVKSAEKLGSLAFALLWQHNQSHPDTAKSRAGQERIDIS
ncbi:hypothetical protein Q4610_12260 [Sphingobium sp. HBC34]|uniref:Uncharacterized protein n=1 Tax=Sphingobium cyanobacteriorum TaxID=3063954 RepID=A0ABT8ZMN8_9SPHN|nr:hypothetical protein [Sphingobium sp. HBC34]MDO7835817.1 hypothetical protein [Sphingobium sp. HBC34]